MKPRLELDDDLIHLWEALLRLRKKLDDYTISRWKRINPFVENLFEWKEKGSVFGDDITIFDSTTIIGDVVIGDHTWIGPFCSIDGTGGLTIGSCVSISAGCRILTHDTVKWALSGGKAEYEYAPTRIGDCCFLGACVVVLKGVTVGNHCVVGAGAVVTKDVPDYSIVAGVPARRIGTVHVDENGEVRLEYKMPSISSQRNPGTVRNAVESRKGETKVTTIALVNITGPFRSSRLELQAPLALMYLSAALKEAGFDTIVEDILVDEIDESVARVTAQNPLFVGLSTTFGVFIPSLSEYSQKVKKINPNIPIVWGGINASAAPELCLKEEYIDYVCMFEGERTVQELAQVLERGEEPEGVLGVGYRKDGQIVLNPRRPFEKNIDNFRVDWDCVDLSRYVSEVGGSRLFRAYQTTRGCPYDCTFCYNSAYNRRRYRPHSIEYVLQDMQMLKDRLDINVIQFVDDHFFVNKKRAFEILYALKDMGIRATNLDVRAPEIDNSFMEKIVDCGCDLLYVGFESENERVLEVMNKEITREDIENVLAVSDKYPDVWVCSQFIVGIPSHTREEIINSVRYAIQKFKEHPRFVLGIVRFTPLPGTVLEQEAIKAGYTPPQSINEHARFGARSDAPSTFEISWLPWATEKDKKILQWILPMSVYLVDSHPHPASRGPKRFLDSLFFRIAYWRMWHLNFDFLCDRYVFTVYYPRLLKLLNVIYRPIQKLRRLLRLILSRTLSRK